MSEAIDAEVSAQLLLFAEQTADFVGVADPWGRVLYLNPAARKRLGVADTTDLTLADVMGKGLGSALVMATLRTALRMAPRTLGPAARLERVAGSMVFGAGAGACEARYSWRAVTPCSPHTPPARRGFGA